MIISHNASCIIPTKDLKRFLFFFSNMALVERLVLKKYVCINICIIIIIIYRFLSGGSEDDLTNFSLEKSNENSFLGELYKLKLNAFDNVTRDFSIYPNTTCYQYLKSGSGNGFPNDMHHADMHRNFLADLKIDMTWRNLFWLCKVTWPWCCEFDRSYKSQTKPFATIIGHFWDRRKEATRQTNIFPKSTLVVN